MQRHWCEKDPPLLVDAAVATSLCWSQASSPFRTYLAKACFREGPRIGAFLPTYVVAMLYDKVEAFKARALRFARLQSLVPALKSLQ